METKDKLIEIIKKAKKSEMIDMKMKEQDAGSLAAPKEAPASMKTGPGGKYEDLSGQNKTMQPAKVVTKEADAGELAAPQEAKPSIDTQPTGKATPDTVGQNKGQTPTTKQEAVEEEVDEDDVEEVFERAKEKYREAKKNLEEKRKREAAKCMDEKKKEAAEDEDGDDDSDDAEEKVKLEKFKEEYEDDMTKVTDILEALKEQVEALKKRMEGIGEEPVTGAKEEPQPPMTESARLSQTFVEAIGNKDLKSEKDFKAAVQKVIY